MTPYPNANLLRWTRGQPGNGADRLVANDFKVEFADEAGDDQGRFQGREARADTGVRSLPKRNVSPWLDLFFARAHESVCIKTDPALARISRGDARSKARS